MRLMGLQGKSSFKYRVRNQGLRTLVIGRASLVCVDDVMRLLRTEGVQEDGV